MPFQSSTDVFVIGGGPAGLAAALAARRRGFSVTVADSSVPPIDKACGEGIMPDGLTAARSLGLDLETGDAQHFRGIRFRAGDHAVEASFPQGYGLGMRRTELHQLMVDRAAEAGVRMMWGARVAGIGPGRVMVNGGAARARWIVGADGGHSAVRRWAGLDGCERNSLRYGFRRHYHLAPWSEYMELHWGDGCQLYVTPVSSREVCVVLISGNPRLRLDAALPQFGELQRRLAGRQATPERGGISASRRLQSVYRGDVALLGDASGSVDAITGEGLCLLFQQSVALAEALEAGDLSRYQAEHRRIGKRPELMADLMLFMDSRTRLRTRTMRALESKPALFRRMLALHVGEVNPRQILKNGVALGWQILTV
ncbi:MAG: FAD-dependent monooxygenase [Candidatus Sulfopaludibacter sp.]|nr:FAD-dependent monooxygenase [Candidatus Sulfopaludibacter sp.]